MTLIPVSASATIDSLEFDSRFDLYRYVQRGLEDYFDTGDTVLLARLEQAAGFILFEFKDDFYVRQCRKFITWRREAYEKRNQLKLQFSSNLEGLGGTSGPLNIYISQMAELGDAFLGLGDSSSASTSWQHAAANDTGTDLGRRILQQSLRVSRSVGDLDGLSRSYTLMGRSLNDRMEFSRAGAYFDSARVIKAELGDESGEAECLSNIASVYLSIGDKKNALRFAEESLSMRRNLSDSSAILQSLVSMIPAFAREVPPASLNNWLAEALNLSQMYSQNRDSGRLFHCRAVVAELNGELDSALLLYDTALQSSTSPPNPRAALAVLQGYAALESSLGLYTTALEHYLQAEEIAAKSRNRVAQATVFHNLGALHQKLGDLEPAIDYYQRALEIRQQIELRFQSVETLNNLAELYRTVGDTTSSMEYTKKAIEVAQFSNDNRSLGSALINQARLEQLKGNHSRALQLLDSASAVRSGSYTVQRRIDLLCLKSEFCREDKNLGQAREYLARVELLLDSCPTYSNIQKVDIIKSNIAIDAEQWPKAYSSLARVIARSEKSRGAIPDPQLRGSFQSQTRSVYEQMIKVLYHIRQSGDPRTYDDSLLFYIERAKSRGLLDAIAAQSHPEFESSRNLERPREHRILSEIETLESSLVDDSLPNSVKAKVSKLAELEQELTDVRLRTSIKDPARSRVYFPVPVSVTKLQAGLPNDRIALLTYLLTPETSYALLISRTQCKIELLSERAPITRAISEYMRLIQLSIKNDSLLDSLHIAATQVGQLLLPKSFLEPDSFDDIFISADGVLSILPFEALKIDGKYLIEYAAIATLPSIFLFSPNELEPRRTQNWRILALADPRSDSQQRQLPFSVREVDWICDTFGANNCTVLSASMATKAELLRLNLTDFQIVHAATHSTINYRDPTRSKIWLSADTSATNAENYLTLAEVDGLKLGADLVVLSSCESGGGKLDFSEGMDGFVKAFMKAGARNMLVSLWEVEDFTTATFMKTFYINLTLGYSNALRQAKLEMINSPRLRHRHPYYWSPFILTVSGD